MPGHQFLNCHMLDLAEWGPMPMSSVEVQTKCESYCHKPVLTVERDADINEAYQTMMERDISCLAVVDGDSSRKIVGVVSLSDLIMLGTRQSGTSPTAASLVLPHRNVDKVMKSEVVTLNQHDSVQMAAAKMIEHGIHRVFLVGADGDCCGVLSTRDLMAFVRDRRMDPPIAECMSSPVEVVEAHEPISGCIDKLQDRKVTGLAVVEGSPAVPVGVFTQRDALLFRDAPRSTPVDEVMDPAVIFLPGHTPLYRAAAKMLKMNVRRVFVTEEQHSQGKLMGILSGFNFAEVVARNK